MANAGDVLLLVPLIYEASIDASQWTAFLQALNTRLDGATSALHLQCTNSCQTGHIMAAVGVDGASCQRYDEYYSSRNIWTIRGRHRLREGAVLTGEEVCSNTDLERSEYYTDYLRPLGLYHALASVPSADGDTSLILSTFRSKSRGAFERDMLALQQYLTPHLGKAARIHDRLVSAELERSAMQDALEQLPTGVVLLDDRLRVLFASRVARRLAAARDGFELTREGPIAASKADTAKLRRLIASAMTAFCQVGSLGGGSMKLRRPSGNRALEVLITPLSGAANVAVPPRTTAILFISDPENRVATDLTMLGNLYGLTPAEARFASAMLQGRTVAEIADSSRITMNTARWTVKQILSKTGTRSQSQAVALMLGGLMRIYPPRQVLHAAHLSDTP